MRSLRSAKWGALTLAAGTLLQITACLGPDPQFYVTSVAVNAVISSLVQSIFNLFLGGVTA